MPAVGFTKPGHDGHLSFEEAPAWYEEHTEVPGEAIALVAALEGDPRRLGINLSPSSLDQETTCRRQLLIKKFLPYLINGVDEWQATEGTTWHEAFQHVAPQVDGGRWFREVLLPNFFNPETHAPASFVHADTKRWQTLVDAGTVRLFEYVPGIHSSWEVQIFPGIWVNGKVDKLRNDFYEIQDYKTKAWSGQKNRKTGQHEIKHYPPSLDAGIQMNAYARMVEVLSGVKPAKLYHRRVYRGARVAREAWKKYEIPPMSSDELESRIRPHVEQFVAWATAMKEIKLAAETAGRDPIPELLAYLDNVPLEGRDRRMLKGTKCPTYCTQMPICFDRAGLVRFESRAGEARLFQITEKKA